MVVVVVVISSFLVLVSVVGEYGKNQQKPRTSLFTCRNNIFSRWITQLTVGSVKQLKTFPHPRKFRNLIYLLNII